MHMITIKCKAKDCNGLIFYEPQDVQLNFVMYDKLVEARPDLTFPLAVSDLNVINRQIIEDPKNKFNTIETVWLTCDTDPFHANPYQVPKK